MPNLPISGLPSGSSLTGTDLLVAVQEATTVQINASSILNYVTASLPTTYTGSFATTGSNIFIGNQIISGSLVISGSTELGGNLVPQTARGATLGTIDRPFADIFVSSGSINIAGIPGDPNTTISNVGGNLLISAGGMRLVGSASFIAVTGSFGYISGSMTQVGDYIQLGTHVLTGNSTVSGSLYVTQGITGSLTGTSSYSSNSNLLDGKDSTEFATTGSNNFNGNQTITGSLNVSSVAVVSSSLTTNSSSLYLTSGSNFYLQNNSIAEITGSLIVTGSSTLVGNATITGSLTLSSGSALNINNGFYVNGNRQFNYGQWYSLETQSGSADTAYPMKLNTTDISSGINLISGSYIRVNNTGTYNLQFSAQFQETVNAAAEISIWLRKGGVNVTNSNTELTIEKVAGGGKIVAAWNYMVQLNAAEYVELVWSSDKSTTELHYHATQSTPTRPATPSLIVTMTQIA